MTNNEIMELIENSDFDIFGIRCDDAEYQIGDTVKDSHHTLADPLYDENDELVYPYIEDGIYAGSYDGGRLNGACAVVLNQYKDDCVAKCLKTVKIYDYCKHIYLIAGRVSECGNDPDEIIIESAKVIAIIE